MKRITVIAFTAAAALLMWGCPRSATTSADTASDTSHDVVSSATASADVEGVAFGVESTVYPATTDSVRVKIWNDTREEITTGANYEIDRFSDGEWVEVPLALMFTSIAYIIPPDNTHWFTIGFNRDEYDYPTGRYRVKKTAVYADGENTELIAEFELK